MPDSLYSVCVKIDTVDRHQFNGLFSGTFSVGRHQKRQTILDFNEARDDGVASAGPYAKHLHLAPNRYHASTSPLNFYRPDALPDTQPTVSKN